MLKQKSSARVNNRYFLIRGKKEEIEKAILDYIGILGWARAAPRFIKTDGEKIILVIDRNEINDVRAAFVLCADKIEVLRVSGTLRGLEK